MLWMVFVVAACGDQAHPLADALPADSAPHAPGPVVLDSNGAEVIFEDPTGNTLLESDGAGPRTFSVDMPQGGTVVVINDGYICTEPTPTLGQVCYVYIYAVRGVKPGDHVTVESGASLTFADSPGSPDAVTAGCSAGWDIAPKVLMQAYYDIIVEDPAAGPATIPTLGTSQVGCSRYDAYCNGYTPPVICAPP